jgi:hypothetical protein
MSEGISNDCESNSAVVALVRLFHTLLGRVVTSASVSAVVSVIVAHLSVPDAPLRWHPDRHRDGVRATTLSVGFRPDYVKS